MIQFIKQPHLDAYYSVRAVKESDAPLVLDTQYVTGYTGDQLRKAKEAAEWLKNHPAITKIGDYIGPILSSLFPLNKDLSNPTIDSYKEPTYYINSYLHSPGFRNRLLFIKSQEERDNYYNNALNNSYESIKIVPSDPSFINTIITGIYTAANAMTGSNPDPIREAMNKPTSYDPHTKIISIDNKLYDSISPDKLFEAAHEYGHHINPTDRADIYREKSKAPKEYQEIHNKKEASGLHDNTYAETYSDLMATRWDLFKNSIYDSRDTVPFTKKDYNLYKNYLKENKKHNRLIEQFKEKDFIDLINKVAYNQSNNEFNEVMKT